MKKSTLHLTILLSIISLSFARSQGEKKYFQIDNRMELDKENEEITLLDKSIRIYPKKIETYNNYFFSKENSKSTFSECNEVNGFNSKNEECYFKRACLHIELNEKDSVYLMKKKNKRIRY